MGQERKRREQRRFPRQCGVHLLKCALRCMLCQVKLILACQFSHFCPKTGFSHSLVRKMQCSCIPWTFSSWNNWIEVISNLPESQSLNIICIRGQGEAWERRRKDGGGDGWREQSRKREIVTTELVAGADFFHHLPCAAGRQRLEVWERVRVRPRPQHPSIKHNATSYYSYWNFKKLTNNKFGLSCPMNILKFTWAFSHWSTMDPEGLQKYPSHSALFVKVLKCACASRL